MLKLGEAMRSLGGCGGLGKVQPPVHSAFTTVLFQSRRSWLYNWLCHKTSFMQNTIRLRRGQ